MIWLDSIEKVLIKAKYNKNEIDILVLWATQAILNACNHFFGAGLEKLLTQALDGSQVANLRGEDVAPALTQSKYR